MAAVAQPLCSLVLWLVPAIGGAHKSVAAGHLIIVIISIIPIIIISSIRSIRSGNLVANWDANLVPVAPPSSLSPSRNPNLCRSICYANYKQQMETVIKTDWLET